MTERLKFPDEPIRVTGDPMRNGAYFPASGDPADENYDPFGIDEEDSCQTCGGDGFADCDDPLQCTSEHLVGQGYVVDVRCPNCGGSGDAKDQRYW